MCHGLPSFAEVCTFRSTTDKRAHAGQVPRSGAPACSRGSPRTPWQARPRPPYRYIRVVFVEEPTQGSPLFCLRLSCGDGSVESCSPSRPRGRGRLCASCGCGMCETGPQAPAYRRRHQRLPSRPLPCRHCDEPAEMNSGTSRVVSFGRNLPRDRRLLCVWLLCGEHSVLSCSASRPCRGWSVCIMWLCETHPQGKSSSEQRGHRELWLHHRLQGRQRGRGRRGSAPAVRCYLPCVAARFQLSATPACTSLLQPARNLSPGLRRQNLRVQTPMRNARVHDEICAPL